MGEEHDKFDKDKNTFNIYIHHVGGDQGQSETQRLLHKIFNRLDAGLEQLMPLGQELLDKVTEMDTKVDGVVAFITALAADGTISPAVKAAILAKIQGSEDKLDAALGANVPPTT